MYDGTFDGLTEGWMVQPNISSCLPVCIFNVLTEMAKRVDNVFKDTYSYGKISVAVRYDIRLGTSWDLALDGIRRMFREDKVQHWILRDQDERRSSSERICSIIDSPTCSFPILSLGAEYLRDTYDIELVGNPYDWPSHCVVAIQCQEKECILHDPYAPINGESPIKRMTRSRLEDYWTTADPIKAMAWFEKVSMPLEQYTKVRL